MIAYIQSVLGGQWNKQGRLKMKYSSLGCGRWTREAWHLLKQYDTYGDNRRWVNQEGNLLFCDLLAITSQCNRCITDVFFDCGYTSRVRRPINNQLQDQKLKRGSQVCLSILFLPSYPESESYFCKLRSWDNLESPLQVKHP